MWLDLHEGVLSEFAERAHGARPEALGEGFTPFVAMRDRERSAGAAWLWAVHRDDSGYDNGDRLYLADPSVRRRRSQATVEWQRTPRGRASHLAAGARFRERHPEVERARHAAYRARRRARRPSPEVLEAQRAARRVAKLEREKARYRANPEKYRAAERARRAARRGATLVTPTLPTCAHATSSGT